MGQPLLELLSTSFRWRGIATGGPFGSGLPFLSLADLPTTQDAFLCSVVEVSIVTFSSL